MSKKVLIVGGVAGGASAAARLRRLDENAEIVMFERDGYISFANCGLPYHIGGAIKERDKLILQSPEKMKSRFNIDVRVNSEVTGVNIKEKKVTVKSRDKGVYEENYDYLVLAPGAKPMKPPIPGINDKRIFSLRNIPDMDGIKAYIKSNNVKSAVIIGGGFIGVEMAENLKDAGLSVALVEAAPHILAPFDSDMVTMAEKELQDNGVNLILNDGVKEFKSEDKGLKVILGSGNTESADMVILAIGVTPDTAFIKDSGIELNERGYISVNDSMETNAEGVYAVGDAVLVKDFVTGDKSTVALAGPANKQGRIAADNIAGLKSEYKGTQGTFILKVFSLSAASTGANERTLTRKNIPFRVVYVHPQSHASYYPGSSPISIKLIFNDEGRILGSQAIGYEGVDKRIDVIASVMRLKGTVDDLTEMELSYAPPFSSAKDPVNMAGFYAQDVLRDLSETVNSVDIDKRDKASTVLLDVRTEMEYNNGHIEGAVNIPVDELRERIDELDKDKTILAYCQVGFRGYIAGRILQQKGYNNKNLTGGYRTYHAAQFRPEPVEDSGAVEDICAYDKNSEHFDKELDACGLCCPGPLMQVKGAIDGISEGQVLKVTASDPGFYEDIKSWCTHTGNQLMDLQRAGSSITAIIKKSSKEKENTNAVCSSLAQDKDNKTLVVFSGDLDKAIASFIIANGAASMGKKVTMFFTFWGLNILRRSEKVNVKKGLVEKMFGIMMPRGSKKLKLSNMNMMGMGARMIRTVMKNKNISSLEDLIKAAIDNGIQIVACQMSMDVMGIRKEELIDGVKIGGVGYYLGEAEDSNVNLFV